MNIEELIKQSNTVNILAKGSTKMAQKMLSENETAVAAINANVATVSSDTKLNPNGILQLKDKQNGVIVLTNKRIYFCSSVLGRATSKEILLKNIQSIDIAYSIIGFGQLRIKGITEYLIIDGKKDVLNSFKNSINNSLN